MFIQCWDDDRNDDFDTLFANKQNKRPVTRPTSCGFGLANIVTSENEISQDLVMNNIITTVNSETYDLIGGHKHSLNQDV